jgi:hypothetical protein
MIVSLRIGLCVWAGRERHYALDANTGEPLERGPLGQGEDWPGVDGCGGFEARCSRFNSSGGDRRMGLSRWWPRQLPNRHSRKVCGAAGIGSATKVDASTRAHTPKDLRDTYASRLLTAGTQLGQPDVSITARHYARWTGGNAYRIPLDVREGEVPADLLSLLDEWSPQKSLHAANA